MNKLLLLFAVLFLFSCQKKEAESRVVGTQSSIAPPYDTIAKDSFSAGAISVDVAQKIRRSSVAYQDSVRAAKMKLAEEKAAAQLKEEQEKADKKAEADKKKADDAKNAKEKEKQSSDGVPTDVKSSNP